MFVLGAPGNSPTGVCKLFSSLCGARKVAKDVFLLFVCLFVLKEKEKLSFRNAFISLKTSDYGLPS